MGEPELVLRVVGASVGRVERQELAEFVDAEDQRLGGACTEVGVADASAPDGELDFTALSHVLGGSEHRDMGGAGDLMMIDRGTDQGVAPGARFAVYRDVKVGGLPLASVGEAVVISTGKTNSVVRLTRTRDVVQVGDFLVPRK